MEDKEEIYHVGIEDVVELRRKILQTSKDIINILREYEELRKIRIEKISKIIELKKRTQELTNLLSILKKRLPQTQIIAKKVSRVVPIPTETDPNIELNDLERDLKMIEQRLKNISNAY